VLDATEILGRLNRMNSNLIRSLSNVCLYNNSTSQMNAILYDAVRDTKDNFLNSRDIDFVDLKFVQKSLVVLI
jgi:hypothetical protein